MYTPKIDKKIGIINDNICRHIENLNGNSRGMISQDILAQLRNLTEYIMVKYYAEAKKENLDIEWENIQAAVKFVEGRGELKLLRRFHEYLQIVASHYTLDKENSERLMLKYYEYLLKIKRNIKETYGLDILENIQKFPLNTDKTLQEFYNKIAEKIDSQCTDAITSSTERYYIQKVKPFFINDNVYYEITFTQANDYANKFDRINAFTDFEITENYAVKLALKNDSIQILEKNMPILIITAWEISIRDCEYTNFSKVVSGEGVKVSYPEKLALSKFMTQMGINLVDLATCSNSQFEYVENIILQDVQNKKFFDVLKKCRTIILVNAHGANMLRYLLYRMNNKVIKEQTSKIANYHLSNLYLENRCIPFDDMPFINSPIGHNPHLRDLFSCIPFSNRKHELLARLVRNNTEIRGQLFTSVSDITDFVEIPALVQKYNGTLWFGHREANKLVIDNGQIFINSYKDDTCYIIKKIKELSAIGVKNYRSTVSPWLNDATNGVDCDEKREALHHMFDDSSVALIYGSAGTGKSTMINYIAHLFLNKTKLFLAQTNPAVDNLKRRVTASNSNFMTITKFIKRANVETEYDILFIDECSTVSNRDMRKLLTKATYNILVLVGDIYQISSIRFGNWFSIAKEFVPKTSITELTVPYRGRNNKELQKFWKRVRNIGNEKFDGDAVLEVAMRHDYSVSLDASIFNQAEVNEIILCLNYDGLYGINNINRFLQECNPSPCTEWGIKKFKINDPILFSDSERLAPAVYNNMKGKIVGIEIIDSGTDKERIQFDIELDKVLNTMEVLGTDIELMENYDTGNSVIRFCVNKHKSTDNDDNSSIDVIPFQVAYAVSIHKSQGIEYNSVKIVIMGEVDELITHNIFYTAITRAQKRLKIYWTPEVENRVLSSIRPMNNRKDLMLIKKYL